MTLSVPSMVMISSGPRSSNLWSRVSEPGSIMNTSTPRNRPSFASMRRVIGMIGWRHSRPNTVSPMNNPRTLPSVWIRKCSRSARSIGAGCGSTVLDTTFPSGSINVRLDHPPRQRRLGGPAVKIELPVLLAQTAGDDVARLDDVVQHPYRLFREGDGQIMSLGTRAIHRRLSRGKYRSANQCPHDQEDRATREYDARSGRFCA